MLTVSLDAKLTPFDLLQGGTVLIAAAAFVAAFLLLRPWSNRERH